MTRKPFYILQSLLIIILTLGADTTIGQEAHEAQLIKAHRGEPNPEKKFLRLMALGEYYKENNIYRADSIQKVILKRSRNFGERDRRVLFYDLPPLPYW